MSPQIDESFVLAIEHGDDCSQCVNLALREFLIIIFDLIGEGDEGGNVLALKNYNKCLK